MVSYYIEDIKCTDANGVVTADVTTKVIMDGDDTGTYKMTFNYPCDMWLIPEESDEMYPLYKFMQEVCTQYADGDKDYGKQFIGNYVTFGKRAFGQELSDCARSVLMRTK